MGSYPIARGSKKKVYVVFYGKNTGFYSSVDECRSQVEDGTGALYKSFNSMEEATSYWMGYWARSSLRRTLHITLPLLPIKTGLSLHTSRATEFRYSRNVDELNVAFCDMDKRHWIVLMLVLLATAVISFYVA